MEERMDGWKDECIDRCMHGCINGWMDAWVHPCMHGWITNGSCLTWSSPLTSE